MDRRLVAGSGRRLAHRLALLHHRGSGTQQRGVAACQEAATVRKSAPASSVMVIAPSFLMILIARALARSRVRRRPAESPRPLVRTACSATGLRCART